MRTLIAFDGAVATQRLTVCATPGRVGARVVAEETESPRFVEGEPVIDRVIERGKYSLRVEL